MNALKRLFPLPTFAARLRSLSLFLVLGLLTTSCFDIEEEITLKRDGSGSYVNRVDMTQMMDMMKGFGGLDGSMDDNSLIAGMDSSMQANVANLREVEGLSNVAYRLEGYMITISYDFDEVEALNRAAEASQLEGQQAGLFEMAGTNNPNYSFNGKTFSRAEAPIQEAMDALGEDEDTQAGLGMAKMMMGEASYRLVYHVPGKIKRMSNDMATLSQDKKTAILNVGFLDLIEGKAQIGNKITFK